MNNRISSKSMANRISSWHGSMANTSSSRSNKAPVVQGINPLSHFANISEFFEQSKFADCIVACEGREFQCHKIILANCSPVFDAMFTHDMEENRKSKVDIVDIDGETVYDMIVYIYSGKVTDLKDKATGLLFAADKYDLKELKKMCEEYLCDTITQDNVLYLLVLADLHGASWNTVRGVTLKFIVDNKEEIFTQAGWRDKLKSYPEIMADMLEAITRQPAKRQKRMERCDCNNEQI